MKRSMICFGLFLLAWSGRILAESPAQKIQTVTVGIPGVVQRGATIELVKDGFAGADDPIGLPDGSLLFTEPNANRVSKLSNDNRITTFIENTNAGLGMSMDSQGRLIQAQSADGQTKIAVIFPRGSERIIGDNYNGRPFSRPNDLIVDRKGGVYVTDPGLTGTAVQQMQQAQGGKPLAPRLPPAVYYIPAGLAGPAGGVPVRIADGIERPNGITLSPDERTLYVNNTNGVYMLAFDVQPDGTVRNRRNIGPFEGRSQTPNGIPGIMTGADGLTIDDAGRLYAVTSAGIEIFTPDGKPLGIIHMSCGGMDCQGLAFAGPEKRTLYIAGRGSLWKVEMLAKGFTGRAK